MSGCRCIRAAVSSCVSHSSISFRSKKGPDEARTRDGGVASLGLRVQGLGYMGSGYIVYGMGFKFQVLGFRV